MADDIPVIVNAKSGPGGSTQDVDAIHAAFQSHRLRASVTVLQPGQDIAQLVDELVADGPKTIVAGGGDGTINAVAARLLNQDINLGVLALGTLNHFARDLGIASDIDAAVRIIGQGHSICVDVGEVNDRIFLNNSSMGLYPQIVREREHAQKLLGLGKWPALARATIHALRDASNFSATLCVNGKNIERRTPFIFVGNNRYLMEGFSIGKRPRLDGGVLTLYVLRPKTGLGLLWLGVRALFAIGSHRDDFDAFDACEFRIEAQGQQVEVATDGEVSVLNTPMHYTIHPKALRVLAPRAGMQAAGTS